MKTFLILVLTYISITSSLYSQCDESYINELIYSDNPLERTIGVKYIAECKLSDYAEELSSLFQSENDLNTASYILTTLESFKWHSLYELAKDFLHKDYENPDDFFDVLERKVIATTILIQYNDFSEINNVIEIVNRDKPNLTIETINCLIQIIKTNQLYVEFAINELEIVVLNSNDYLLKAVALDMLLNYTIVDISTLLNSIINNDTDWAMRSKAYGIILSNKLMVYRSILHSQALIDENNTNRLTISRRLLKEWGLPIDLKVITENLEYESDQTVIKGLYYIVHSFIPPRPTISTSEMIQNLLGYCSELLKYGWITEDYVYEEIAQMIALIEENYHGQAVPELCSNLETYLGTVEDRFNESLITIEAYKFLFYHGNYIKDNVELEFGDCQ